MTNINKYAKLLKELSKNDNSQDPLKVLIKNINTKILSSSNISFNPTAEGTHIDLAAQNILIYKNKLDATIYLKLSDEQKDIIIIQDKITYVDGKSDNVFFKNYFYAMKVKKIMLQKNIIAYSDKLNKNFIFLSENIGKTNIGYSCKLLDFCNRGSTLKIENLAKKFEEIEFISFFRDNFMKVSKNIEKPENRFYLSLIKLSLIYENSNREFNLYKNNFSFDKFESKLENEKEKYIKKVNDKLFEFQAKVNSLPIQFGVYIFLVYKFMSDLIPLIFVITLIVIWSCFTVYLSKLMKESVTSIENKVICVFDEITNQTSIKIEEKENIINIIHSIKSSINFYKYLVVFLTITILVISYCFYIDSKHNIPNQTTINQSTQ